MVENAVLGSFFYEIIILYYVYIYTHYYISKVSNNVFALLSLLLFILKEQACINHYVSWAPGILLTALG